MTPSGNPSIQAEHKYRTWIIRPLTWFLKRQARGKNRDQDLESWQKILEEESVRSGVDGYRTANARQIVAMHLEEMGRYVESLPLRQTQFDLLKEHKGPMHADTLAAEMWLSLALMGVGEDRRGRSLMIEVRDLYLSKEGEVSKGAASANWFIDEFNQRIEESPDE